MNTTKSIAGSIYEKITSEISDVLRKINYGTITIVVHNKKITQIEILEKKRFDEFWKIDEGGGI